MEQHPEGLTAIKDKSRLVAELETVERELERIDNHLALLQPAVTRIAGQPITNELQECLQLICKAIAKLDMNVTQFVKEL